MSSFGNKNMQVSPGRSPIGAEKMFSSPIGDMTRFSSKKENQSISVINNFFLDHIKNER